MKGSDKYMQNEKMYRVDDVCKELGISTHTLLKWYQWEQYELRDGKVDKNYLPIPEKNLHMKGRPKFWTADQIAELKAFKESIVFGRHGRYGKYSNPLHKED